jgi:hypothetical protein
MLLITIRFLNGVYFLTMGTKKRECLFGEVANYTVGAGLALPKSNHVSGSITIADYCRGEVASPLLKTEPEIRKRGGETRPYIGTRKERGMIPLMLRFLFDFCPE